MEERALELELPILSIEIEHKRAEIVELQAKIASYRNVEPKLELQREKLANIVRENEELELINASLLENTKATVDIEE